MTTHPIPYGKQWIDDDDIAAVVRTLTSDYLTTGPAVAQFEQDFAKYVGAKYAVAVSNGTSALHAACFAAGLGAGDEVITTSMTFLASANCALYVGAKPVFADIDPITYNIDPVAIERQITPQTKAIVAVHFTGQPCDMEAIHKIAREHDLIVIEDAAHALGAEYKNQRIGALSELTTFSFHPVKHITTAEGGMITTNDEKLYKRLMLFRTHGMNRNPAECEDYQGGWYYEMQVLGYNYRLSDIHAALGSSQLKKSDVWLKRRREIVSRYQRAFAGNPALITPHQASYANSSWHLYVLQINSERTAVTRRQAYDALHQENILVNVHYNPVYLHPYYQQMGYPKGLCPRAEYLYQHMLSLPMFPRMTDDEIEQVIEAVNRIICPT